MLEFGAHMVHGTSLKKHLNNIKEVIESGISQHGLKALDIGPGPVPVRGADTIDYRAWLYGVTFQHDLRVFPWPMGNDVYDLVYSSHCFEHLERRDIYPAMAEVHRISRPGGLCIFVMPHYSGPGAWQTIGHVRPFGILSLQDYTVEEAKTRFRKEAVFLRWRPGFKNRFINLLNPPITWLANLNPHACEQLWCYAVNGFNDVVYVLRVLK